MKITARIEFPKKLNAKFKELKMPIDGGFDEGYDKGYFVGYENGYVEGNSVGEENGYKNGYSDGEEMWKTYWLNTGDHFELPEGMTEIPERMFYQHSSLATIDVPETVTKIGQEAFHSCKGLVAFPLNDNITEIGQYAFYLCENMVVDKFPQNMAIVNAATFAACRKARFNYLNNKVTTIGAYAFDGCWENNIRVIPASVTSIANGGFGSNRKIKSMTILGKPSMTSSAFGSCTNLKDVYCNFAEGEVANAPWGATNATVHYNYFKNASGHFVFPEGMFEIPQEIMMGNTAITDLTIGDEVAVIDDNAFNGCKNLKKVNFPKDLYFIGAGAFLGCPNLEISELPDTVYEIENASLAGTKCALSKLPDNLGKVEVDSFDLCRGNTFTVIPKGVISIGARAFKENTGLTELTFEGTPPTNGIASTAFIGCTNLKDIYVPWSEGDVANAPWGTNATIHYNSKE